jgi:hypothetical protein
VKRFYQAVEDRDWPTSYDMRTADFKGDVTRDLYLGKMAKDGQRLNSYKVLSVQTFADGAGYKAAQIMMEFDHGSSYGCARWKKVVGVWLCEEPGLSALLTSTRIPDWVSH